MSRVPTAGHLASWARSSPERPGPTPSSGSATGGSPAAAAARKAIVAVGRSILVIIWRLLSDPDARYTDLGSDFFNQRINPERRKRAHVHQLEALGYKVTLEPAA